jgi:hypothetical protein
LAREWCVGGGGQRVFAHNCQPADISQLSMPGRTEREQSWAQTFRFECAPGVTTQKSLKRIARDENEQKKLKPISMLTVNLAKIFLKIKMNISKLIDLKN